MLCGCSHGTPIHQSADNVTQVELIDRRSETESAMVCTLTGEQAQQFMKDLNELDCMKRFNPAEERNELEIRIYYASGDMDFLGTGANGYLENGEIQISGWYYYLENELDVLFSAYID
jgi:hypothetical protein